MTAADTPSITDVIREVPKPSIQPVQRLVRVQDELHGASADAQGLVLPYNKPDGSRNTLHFSVNSIVSDHAYGSFNENPDGSIKGKVVIIADPAELPQAAGLGQVDTWYRLSAEENSEGAVRRFLPVGHAVVVAPRGTSIPEGVQAVFYEGGIESRDQKVSEVLQSAGVEIQEAGFRSWVGHDMDNAISWAESVAPVYSGPDGRFNDQKAGAVGPGLHIGVHDGSLDSDLERIGVKGLLVGMSSQRLHDAPDGIQTPYLDVISDKVREGTRMLHSFLDKLPFAERCRIGAHYEAQIEGLERHVFNAQDMDQEWDLRERPALIRSVLDSLPGEGPFFVSKVGSKTHESLNHDELTAQVNGNLLSPKDLIWRSGMRQNWEELDKTKLRDFVKSIPQVKFDAEAAAVGQKSTPPSFDTFARLPRLSKELENTSHELSRGLRVAQR